MHKYIRKLIYLRLFTDCFMKISLQSSKQTHSVPCVCSANRREIFMKQSVTSEIFVDIDIHVIDINLNKFYLYFVY